MVRMNTICTIQKESETSEDSAVSRQKAGVGKAKNINRT